MSEILAALHDEHEEIGKVLDLLEGELGRLDAGSALDTAVLAEVIAYLRDYPARRHHDKEDSVLRKLRARDAAAAAAAGDLDEEHQVLLGLTADFTDAAEGILGAPNHAADGFQKKARTFVNAYRRHIEFEERYLFPAALWSLTADDWAALEAEIAATHGQDTEA